jgi:hypothetical protein
MPHETLAAAFERALRVVDGARAGGMRTITGEPAARQLERLRADLVAARDAAVARGRVDPEWVRGVVRWVADWAPAADVTLLAALGAIARHRAAAPPA